MNYEATIEQLTLRPWGVCVEDIDESKAYRRGNDLLWKGVLEDIFDDFLCFFFPDASHHFDLERGFQYLDKEMEQLFQPEDDQYAPRHVDKLIKAFTRDGSEEWVLIHVEVQGYYQSNFPFRMFQYYYRILDKYQKPVTAFAIFTDDNKNFHPNRFELSYRGTSLRFIFNTYKILEQDETKLEQSDNPFAMVVLTVKTTLGGKYLEDEQLYGLKIRLMKRLLSKRIPKKKIEAIMVFLQNYIRFENRELNTKFEKEHLTGRRKTMGIKELVLEIHRQEGLEAGRKEGIREGIEQGIEQQRSELIQNLLRETDFSVSKIAQLAGVDVEFVEKIKKEQGIASFSFRS